MERLKQGKKSWKRHGQQRVECTFQNALLSWHVSRSKIQFRVQYEFLFWEPLTSFGDNFEAEMACLWPYLFRHSCHSSSPKASLRTLLERQSYIRKTGVPPESLPCHIWVFKLAVCLLDVQSFLELKLPNELLKTGITLCLLNSPAYLHCKVIIGRNHIEANSNTDAI